MSQNIGNDGPPPIPAGGLPPGWDLEQWNHYGQQWLIQNPQTTAPTVPVNNYPTVSATPPTAPTPPTPPTPSNQDMIQQPTPPVVVQPPVMMVPHYKTNSNPGKIIGIIAIVGVLVVVMIIVLSGVLYVWANSLDPSSADEIEGTWYNPVDTLTLYPNGTVIESEGVVTQWRTNSNDLYFTIHIGEDDIEVRAIYDVRLDDQGDSLLFIAFYQTDTEIGNQTNEVDEASCIAYSSSISGAENEHFDDRKTIFPSWCNPDHDI